MDRPGITKAEISARHAVPAGTVNDWVRAADWPAPIGKRGRFVEYDPAEVEAAISRRRHAVPAAAAGLGSRLLTTAEIAEVFGLNPKTVRADASRGRLGEAVEQDGIRRFPADQVASIIAGRGVKRAAR